MITASTAQSGMLCLRLSGALDAAGAAALQPAFETLGEAADQDVLLEISGIGRLDGAGVGAVAYLYKRLAAQDRPLLLQGAQGQPLAMLRELGLTRLLEVEAPPRSRRFGKGLAWAR
jgi:anti-anti-sigma factor